ncbi:MAG: two-component regulator propeller domain-containing protein [Bacteroidota bacterium]
MSVRFLKIVLLWLVVAFPAYGQFYEMTRYADDNGLPSRIVRDVDQDAQGYLWVAGNNGLYKFDGQQFHAYYSVLNDTTGLRDNKINTLVAARDGRIWIATPKGLHVLKGETITYVELTPNASDVQNHIIELFEDRKGNIWVGSYNGLFVIEEEGGKVIHLNLLHKELLNEKAIWGLSEDKHGRIWVARARNRPLLIDPETYSVKELAFKIEGAFLEKDINAFNYIEYNDSLILVSAGSGILKGRLANDSTFHIQKFKDENGGVVGDHFMYQTIVDSEGTVWGSTWRNYLKKYQVENGNLVEQEVNSKNGFLGMTPFARSVYEDSQKNIWIPNSNGLYKLSETQNMISVFPPGHLEGCSEETYSIYGITEDDGGHLWTSTPYNLYRFNKEEILENRCPTNYLHFTDPQLHLARDIFIDSSNRLWISGQNGLSIAQLDENYEPGPFAHFSGGDGLPHNWSNAILEETPNKFWLGNYHRLIKMEFPNGDFRNPISTVYDSSREREDALVNSYVMALEKDKNGALWIGTFSGLSRLISEEGEGTFENYISAFGQADQLSNNAIKNIFSDSKGRLWIGTQTGLNLYLEETNNFKQFGRKEGLPSEYILGIDEDSEGRLRIATTSGLFTAIYNQSMQSFVHIEYITARDGLADNITNKNALYIDADDNVFVGSSKGLSVLSNTETSVEARPFNLGLTTLEGIQKKGQGFVSIKHRIENEVIELSYFENSIQLGYAVLDFTGPSFNQYRHKFLPISEDWIETGKKSELNYYNLSPGEYELILDGSNNQGVWSNTPLHLKVVVHPPFWKSGWAMALYVLLLLGVVRLFYILRIRKRVRELEQETRLEKALVREREQLRNENAADFHDELGSKVTKISMFLTLAERTLNEQKDPSNWFGKMRENIKDLSGSFRDLLWVIDPHKDSLSDAFLRLKDFGEDLFSSTQAHYSTSGYSEGLEETMLDPQTKKQVVLIFKEAMHNCAKYSDSTLVELTVENMDGYASIRLKDNGKGFNVHRQSKGRGLTNMKNRSDKIGGSLSIVSGEQGTVVVLNQIPHLREGINDK